MSGTNAIRVVMVDDSAEFLRAASGFLRGLPGIELIGTAVSGMEAIAAVQALRPDLILLDFEMPGMTGAEAARVIKTLNSTVRIVIVSLHEQVRTLVGPGCADDFVAKASFIDTCPDAIARLFADRGDRLGIALEEGR